MILKSVLVVATSLLAVKLVQQMGRSQLQHQASRDRQRHSDDVSRWEAEGGNLPARPPQRG